MAAHALAGKLLHGKDEDAADAIFSWLYRRRSALTSWTMVLWCDIVETITPQLRDVSCRTQTFTGLCLPRYVIRHVFHLRLHLTPPEMALIHPDSTSPATSRSSTEIHVLVRHTFDFPLHPTLAPRTTSLPLLVGACEKQISDGAGSRKCAATRTCISVELRLVAGDVESGCIRAFLEG